MSRHPQLAAAYMEARGFMVWHFVGALAQAAVMEGLAEL